MKVFAYEHTIREDGILSLKNLPFSVGEKIEVVIIPRSKSKAKDKRYPFWGEPITYLNPTEPIAQEDWELYG